MQSRTQRSSPVPGRNWKRLLGRRFGRRSLPSRLRMTSPLTPSLRRDLLAIEEAVVEIADVAGLAADRDLLGQASAEGIGPGDDQAVIHAELEEGVADGADLGDEVLVRDRDLAVLVSALLLVGDLVLDLEAARTGLDHLLGQQIGRLRVAEPGIDVGDDRHDMRLELVDRASSRASLTALPAVPGRVDLAEHQTEFAGIGLPQEGVELLDQRRERWSSHASTDRGVGRTPIAARRSSSPTGRGIGPWSCRNAS